MFQEKIAQRYARLGRNQKKIADFLTQRYHEAAFINAFALSQRLEVDPATVTRFAQRLGYAGYPELLHEIQEMVKKELKVSELLEARTIYVVAHGLARGPAQTFVAQLAGLLGMAARLVPADHLDTAIALSSAGREDVVVGVSLAALHQDTARVLRLAQSRGAKTIGLCTSHTSPVASAADVILVCPGESTSGIPSTTTMSAILDALFQVLTLQQPQRVEVLKDGLLANVNWMLEEKGEKRIHEEEVLRQV
jgi:DNA-binding MurR/RpiR family transcriptional regulator